jgi:hypothetical protein
MSKSVFQKIQEQRDREGIDGNRTIGVNTHLYCIFPSAEVMKKEEVG